MCLPPSSSVEWQVGHRELYMLDAPRVSTLSLEDGHTKKIVPALSKMATAIKILSYSSDGETLYCDSPIASCYIRSRFETDGAIRVIYCLFTH